MSILILLTGLISFGCIPMLAAGLWLTVGKKKTTTKILGGVIIFLGAAPVLAVLLFWYWLLFHSN